MCRSYVQAGLLYARQDRAALQAHVECVEDTQALRDQLPSLGLVAFVGDGSVLPRRSGACDEPMPASEAVPFTAPASLAVEVSLPNRGLVRGLGIRRGVTLICGGGFHGKSTLLEALEQGALLKEEEGLVGRSIGLLGGCFRRPLGWSGSPLGPCIQPPPVSGTIYASQSTAGVYNKIPGDGRELVATDPSAVKIRAEDGR